MLEFLLAIFAIAVWISIGAYYFRESIFQWLDNRFGKDTPLADLEAASKQDEPPAQEKSKD
ncbi:MULTISPECIES: hypothetical protein [Acetobacter]|uniref:Uncharacterized protein n=3 Tax=Acetobacter TaxID=434 RepID=F1YTT6_9PROT|nr:MULTISPECIES: hypothetical protein [Acetobacter]ANA14074.1 hypothetical protein WG31_08710 [Acetobacter oryzifermentans]ASL40594.1 hypothetical protein CBI36_09295 [Acetobacter oryzifermentans]ATI13065.1 hypothetical protein CPF11_11870 [Acetobacter pomorum]AXC26820.1 hypothetical protein DS739_08560 [Acetobacter sp. JWB]AXN00065.1 hypothetical protein CJF59_05505 [Acetobacter pomorum]